VQYEFTRGKITHIPLYFTDSAIVKKHFITFNPALADRLFMISHRLKLFSYSLLFLFMGCVDSYHPALNKDEVDIMVVNGFINASDRSAYVDLSHANSVSSTTDPKAESNATVTISDEDGVSFTLHEKEAGHYTAEELSLARDSKYQLTVTTINGDQYVSDDIEISFTPPIDSVSWEANTNGIHLFANTHDFTNQSRYYKWSFSETWEYRSVFNSEFKLVGKQPVRRVKSELLNPCYRTIASPKIYLGTTERLSQNIVSRYFLLSIPKGSVKLSQRYSLKVILRAVGKEEYDYLQQLQRTNETLGSLFDPQPSPVSGNIHNVKDESIPVIGYFSGGQVYEKRIFIAFEDIPLDIRISPLPGDCNILDTVCVKKPPPAGIVYCKYDLDHLEGNSVIVGAIYDDKFRIVAYTYAGTDCADCRSQGGTLEIPDFW
jgi:hypothetical protein